jgi:DNA-3-methyladenine glycosylase II
MPESEIDIVSPYNYDLSLLFARGCRLETEGDSDDRSLQRMLLFNETPVFLKINVDSNIDCTKGMVEWSFPEGGHAPKKEILNTARRMISADLDLGSFYRLAKNSRQLVELVERFRGLKPVLTPTVFESAAWSIMGQQVNLNFASTLKTRIVKKFGKGIKIDGYEYSIFPEPHEFEKIGVSHLKKLQFSTRKAEYLLDLAQNISKRQIDLESLRHLDYEKALEILLSMRGLGIWSANYILMRGAGHPDCLPLGDSGLHRAIMEVYGLKSFPDHNKVKILASKFAPYRSLYTLYLWYTLMKEKHVS